MSDLHKHLSIIIVSYNVANELVRCLNIIEKMPFSEIIIVDNNSGDNTYNKLNKFILSNKIRFFKNKKNYGFAKAVNMGISLAKGKYILLLNPDTIPNLNAIDILLNYHFSSKGNNIGLLGGKMIDNIEGRIHGTYVDKPNPLTALFDFTNLKKIFKNNYYTKKFYYSNFKIKGPKLVYGLSGGFLLFKKDLTKEVGMFDENYFMYLEDVDFGVRVRAKGFENYYIPQAKIIHESGSSSKYSKYKINVVAWRNSKRYYVKKHFNVLWYIILSIVFLIDDFVTDIIHIIRKEPLT